MEARQTGPFGPEAQDDDDDISLTSTDHEGDGAGDADKDWVVDDLLAERPHPDKPGQTQYLIKWEGFPLEDCTWEPEENLGPGLLPQWEETKKEIEAGKRTPFDLEIYNAACIAKAERHMKRNAKRKRLGLPLTDPFPEQPSPEHPSPEDSSAPVVGHDHMDSSDEAGEVNEVEPDTSVSREPQIQKHATNQKIFKGIPSSTKVRTELSPTRAPKARRPSHSSLPKPSSEAPQPVISSTKTAGPGGTATGYQGTARKPSTTTNQHVARGVFSIAPGQKPKGPVSKPSSSTNKFAGKRLTATRTRPQPAAQRTSNVFIGGKQRRQRRSLADVMVDPTKAPKQFSTMRIRNIANKRAIDKSDATANFSSIPASFFLTNDGTVPKSKDPPTPSEAPSLTHSPVAISPMDTSNPATATAPAPAPAPKVKKSVRFTEVEDDKPEDGGVDPLFDEPMDIDEPPAAPVASTSHPTGLRKLSLTSYQERGHTQVVSRTVMFGPDSSQELRVMFHGVVRHGVTHHSDSWLSAFMAQDKIHFDTTCASYNFLSQAGFLIGERLSTGAIESISREQASLLENVAEWLRRSSSGMHLVTSEYSILVYPTGCDGWKDLNHDIGTINPEAPLRHLIYKSPIDTRLYPLVPVPLMNFDDPGQGSQCQLLIKELSGLDFDKWLPQEPKQKDNQVYMLLFPPDEAQVSMMIKFWLRSCRPGCRIFSTENPGSWLKFHECVKAGAGGTVIVHSDMTLSLRKIRRIWKMVESNAYTFWDLATGEFDPPLYPSGPPAGEFNPLLYPSYPRASIEPGTLQMTRLFPFGRAILITPSLVLSEPDVLYKFLQWFKNYAANPNYLIMACADFPNYLRDVTLEKEKEYKEFCDTNDRNVNRLLEEFGRRKEDIEATFRAWELLNDIVKNHGDENTSEDIRKVFWITDFIDPNDEQSLVNYFLWWSTTRLDRYRRFYILGSRSSKIKRAYRNIPVPAYTDISVSDPDVAAARQDERIAKENGNDDEMSPGAPIDLDSQSGAGVERSSISQPSFKFPSALFSTDRATELRRWCTNNERLRKASWSRLHANPVSWVDVPMADQFGDALCTYDTFKNWFHGAPPFSSHLNTWYGLFYTIDKVWDPLEPLSTYGRHPWVAIYRPVEPHLHKKGYKNMELFIWDVAAGDNEPTRGHSGCLDMQCRLVDLVREETLKKYPGRFLDRVWVSSATNLKVNAGDNLLDITCCMIEDIYNDARHWLPPFQELLEERGWKGVPKQEWENGMALGSASRRRSRREILPIPRNASDEGKLERSIWHPPRGKPRDGGSTICLNDLYDAALKARLESPSCQMMRYQYRPTVEWYADQAKEHRDAGYIYVDSGERIVNKMFRGMKK
ncbi:hypothetical protein F5X99DRAFT_389932 [Biscogniauxia marginata]|nr:hypothetical protein F5X99DRAFT_389932 [Biscogniauxia marginata]